MAVTNQVGETKGQKTSPKKLTLSRDAGLFYQRDAATQISDQQEHTEGKRKRLQVAMFNAILAGELDGYDMRTGALLHLPFEMTKPICVRVADVNDWAKRTGRDWQWISPNAKTSVTCVAAEAASCAATVAAPSLLPSIVAVITPEPVKATSAGPGWRLTEPKRYQGYGKPLYDLLKAANIARQPCPKARDVLDAWKKNPPFGVTEVMVDGIKYYDAKGNTKTGDLDAIRAAINRMTQGK